jgi:hypothetical protein
VCEFVRASRKTVSTEANNNSVSKESMMEIPTPRSMMTNLALPPLSFLEDRRPPSPDVVVIEGSTLDDRDEDDGAYVDAYSEALEASLW